MVPFTVCLLPIIFRWKYICDKLLCWTLLPKGWWDLSVHFYVLGRSGLLIFRAVAEPRNSGKSAKFTKMRKILRNSEEILSDTCCTTYLKLISATGAIYLPYTCKFILGWLCHWNVQTTSHCVVKNWALAMMFLKALPLVHFWSVLLLKEQMMTSVRKSHEIWLFLPQPVRSPGRSLRLLATVEWQDWFLLLQVTMFVWYSSWIGFLRASG